MLINLTYHSYVIVVVYEGADVLHGSEEIVDPNVTNEWIMPHHWRALFD